MFLLLLLTNAFDLIYLDEDEIKKIAFIESTNKNVIILDFDDTIYDFKGLLEEKHNQNKINCLKKYLQDEYTDELLGKYREKYGITCLGLKERGVSALEILELTTFETFKHFSLKPDEELTNILRKIPGDEWIFTNNQPIIVERLLDELGIKDEIEFVFGPNFYLNKTICKPQKESFEILDYVIKNKRKYEKVYFFDDSKKNIALGKEFKWISICSDYEKLKNDLKMIFLQ